MITNGGEELYSQINKKSLKKFYDNLYSIFLLFKSRLLIIIIGIITVYMK